MNLKALHLQHSASTIANPNTVEIREEKKKSDKAHAIICKHVFLIPLILNS